jgi:DNA-binding transcriptional regulator PaaX
MLIFGSHRKIAGIRVANDAIPRVKRFHAHAYNHGRPTDIIHGCFDLDQIANFYRTFELNAFYRNRYTILMAMFGGANVGYFVQQG